MDYFDINLAKALGGGSGGGGATTKTVTGTLANPWGDINPSELYQKVTNGKAFMGLLIDASALGFESIISRPSADGQGFFTNGALIGFDTVTAYAVAWDADDGTLVGAILAENGSQTDLTPYATHLTTSLSVTYI